MFVDGLIKFLAIHADKIIIACAVVFLAWTSLHHKHHPARFTRAMVREGVDIFASVMIAWLAALGLKIILQVPRPFLAGADIQPLFLYGGYDSLPSGHATVFFALATAIYLYHRKAGLFFYACAAIVSLARIAAGIHFPVDVFAGAVLGGAISVMVFSMIGNLSRRS